MKVNLPDSFLFETCSELIRIGRDNDGGYLISKKDIENSEVLISLGIHNDWTFEKDFINLKDIKVYAYDPTISEKFFFKVFLASLLKIYKPFYVKFSLRKLLSYKNFFSKKNVFHIQKYVGLNSPKQNRISLDEILTNLDNLKCFIKIDIEGSEYRLLDSLKKNHSRITGLAIEFHDVDLHIDKIENFIKSFPLNLIHIHCNNFGEIISDKLLPEVLELTFSKYSDLGVEAKLPHKLDQPNDKNDKEIQIMIG